MSLPIMKGDYWTFSHVWNKSLEEKEERPVEARDYLWASELGKSPIDVFLRLKGEVPTNPPNARAKRKFEAGNIWEWVVKLILDRAGIRIDGQKRAEFQYPDLLKVTGKIDFIAGGMPDFEKAKQVIETLELPEVFTRALDNIMAYFQVAYPNGLDPKILEVKSVGSYVYDSLERTGKALQIHRLQTYHYMKSENMERGDVVYICRDDCRMMEVPIYLGGEVEDEYYSAVKKISDYVLTDSMPPLESHVVFDEDTGKFSKNFRVGYSMYLTKLYGFNEPAEFDNKYIKLVGSWNRVMARIKKGQPMTKSNEEKLEEMKAMGFNPVELLAKFSPDESDEASASEQV